MSEDQIKHMVSRFLMWKLPEHFRPDGGISFSKPLKPNGEPYEHGPSGTNLFDATQANAMVRHMLEGLPSPAKMQTTKAMRDRLLELSNADGRDDYDRAVTMLVSDFEALLASHSVEP